jgi:hypothetical protein
MGPWNYSRFPKGEIGTNAANDPTETGEISTPEAAFQIPPGSPIPAAWSNTIGNALGPGGKTNTSPATPTGVTSESTYAANS